MWLLQGTVTVDIAENLERIPEGANLETSFVQVVASAVNIAIIVGSLALLVYLILGAVNWITSGGDKGKVEGARNKIVQALIGFVILVAAYSIYLFFLNLLNVNLGQPGSGSSGSGSGGGGAASGVCTPRQRGSDGGNGGYCSNGGAAMMECFGPGEGVSALPYNHWEPCHCISGSELPSYNFSSCN